MSPRRPDPRCDRTRRHFFRDCGVGVGKIALASLLADSAGRARAGSARPDPADPLAPRPTHHAPRAKRVIFLFMQGSQSQHDSFEYKPALQVADGKVAPGGGTLTASKFKFAQHGQTGTWVSELYPNVAKHVDKP